MNEVYHTKDFDVVEVTGAPGGECYLLLPGAGGAYLCDTGFSYSAGRTAANVRSALAAGSSALSYILVSHAHYDHAGGAHVLAREFPEAQIAAGELTLEIFKRPGARRLMAELDQNAMAMERGGEGCTDGQESVSAEAETFAADIVIPAGAGAGALSAAEAYSSEPIADAGFCAISTPGHTRDTISYYFESLDLLIATETTGVINVGVYCPTFITSYLQAVAETHRMEEMAPAHILVPHSGLLSGERAKSYPRDAREAAEKLAEFVLSRTCSGLSEEDIAADYMKEYYDRYIGPSGRQPRLAAFINIQAVISRLIAQGDCGPAPAMTRRF